VSDLIIGRIFAGSWALVFTFAVIYLFTNRERMDGFDFYIGLIVIPPVTASVVTFYVWGVWFAVFYEVTP